MREYTTLIARLERSMGTTSSQNLRGTSCVLHLLLTNKIQNYDRRRQKIPCQARSESQGSYQRGVCEKEARQELIFQTHGESR